MSRIAVGIEYDGSGFAGWQQQADAPSLQQAVQQALVRTTGSQSWKLISPGETLDVIGDIVFRLNTASTVPIAAAIAVIVALVLASVVVLERRVRGVEVVT